jgi:hypothetical protein
MLLLILFLWLISLPLAPVVVGVFTRLEVSAMLKAFGWLVLVEYPLGCLLDMLHVWHFNAVQDAHQPLWTSSTWQAAILSLVLFWSFLSFMMIVARSISRTLREVAQPSSGWSRLKSPIGLGGLCCAHILLYALFTAAITWGALPS